MATFVRVAGTTEIAAGQGKTIEVNGKRIALFNVDGTFFAVDDECKHKGGPLGEGELDGCIVACPWHGWTYDVTTGVSPDDPDTVIGRYDVKVERDDVLVAL